MSEHAEQSALFQWAELNKGKVPALDMMFAVPNGGKRPIKTAKFLKEEGVKAGVPDVWLPVPINRPRLDHPNLKYTGLVIEMKFGKNKTTPEQTEWLQKLTDHGWLSVIAYTWIEAASYICSYLGLNHKDYGLDFQKENS